MGNPLKKVADFILTSGSSRTISIIVILIIAAAIPLTVIVSQQQQEIRQRAAGNVITIDSTSRPSQIINSGNTISWNHTIGSLGSNKILIVGVVLKGTGFGSTLPITGASSTFVSTGVKTNLVKYSEKISRDGTLGLAVYYLKNPAPGLHSILINTSSNVSMSAGSTSWYGVNQDTPLSPPLTQENSASSTTDNPYLSTTAQADVVFFDLVGVDITTQSCLFFPNTSQTLLWSFNSTGAGAGSSMKYSSTTDSLIGSWAVPSSCTSSDNVKKWIYTIGKLLPAIGTASTPTITPTPTPTPTSTPTSGKPIPCGNFGDVNGDRVVNSQDSLEIERKLANLPPQKAYIAANADVTGDGQVTPEDAVAIGQYLSDLPVPGTSFVTLGACLIQPYQINGTVFIDANQNGKFDESEQPYTLFAQLAINGNPVGTDGDGNYFYNITSSGTFQVFLNVPTNFNATTNYNVKGVTVPPSRRIDFGIVTIQDCTSGDTYTACTGAANTCNGNGTRTHTTTTTDTGSTECRQINNLESCTGAPANCTAPSVCNSDLICVAPIGVPTATPTPTTQPGATATPTPTTGANPTATPTVTPQPTIPAGNTVFALNIGLDGLGTTGDNVTPNNHSGSNKNPNRKTRNVTVQVCNIGDNDCKTNNNWVTAKTGSINYDLNSGTFKGNVDMGNLAGGGYDIYIKSDGYLRRRVSHTSTTGQTNNIAQIRLVTGDINSDNAINILDYNIFIACSIFNNGNTEACTDAYRPFADLDDNGPINQFDYNLFIRELSVQNGD